MSNEPKPCAHCGGDHVVEEWVERDNRWRRWRVMCDRCGMSTDWHGTREFALGVWNNRPNETAIDTDGLTAERDHFHKHVNRMMDLIADIARKQPYTFDPEAPYETLDTIGNYLDELQEQVDTLTAERDEWKTKYETCELAYKQADAERKRHSEQIDKLFAERDTYRELYENALEREDQDEHDILDTENVENDLPDSREQLEADIQLSAMHMTAFSTVYTWLDRQAEITKNECREEHRQRLSELHDLLDEAAREREELKRRVEYNGELVEKVKRERNRLLVRVNRLTYDAKKWADAASEQRLVAMEQADKAQKLTVENDRLRHQADELVCKIGEITDAASELLRKQPYSFNPGDVVGSLKTVGKYIERLTIELDAYKTFWESSK